MIKFNKRRFLKLRLPVKRRARTISRISIRPESTSLILGSMSVEHSSDCFQTSNVQLVLTNIAFCRGKLSEEVVISQATVPLSRQTLLKHQTLMELSL